MARHRSIGGVPGLGRLLGAAWVFAVFSALASPAVAATSGASEVDDASQAGADDVTHLKAGYIPRPVADVGVRVPFGEANAPAPEIGTFEVGENGVSPAGRVLGVGLQLGVPTGITVKYMFAPNMGVVAGLGVGAGWYFGPALSLHADFIFHPHVLLRAPYLTVSWYVGGGAWIGVADNNARPMVYFLEYVRYFGPRFWLAARGALGINIALNDLPIELYVEGNPALVVFPGLSFGLGFSGGLRFYF